MADSYVETKVREALVAARGSRAVAQQMLMTWAEADDRLLRGMARPFLKAVAAAAVEGAVRRGAGPAEGARSATQAPGAKLSRDALERVLSRVGEEREDQRAEGGAARPEMRHATTALQRGPAGSAEPDHAAAMMTLAKAFAAKKLR